MYSSEAKDSHERLLHKLASFLFCVRLGFLFACRSALCRILPPLKFLKGESGLAIFEGFPCLESHGQADKQTNGRPVLMYIHIYKN